MHNRLAVLLLFPLLCWYLYNASAYRHTHIVDGLPVTHSHPYSGKTTHSHSTVQLTLTAAFPMLCAAPAIVPDDPPFASGESAVTELPQFRPAPALTGNPLRGPPAC